MKHLFSILTAVFAVLAFLISCGGSEGSGNGGQGGSGEAGSIYGVVSDRATGELIRKASVELKDSGSRTVGSYDTGSDGQFDFNELTSGTYTLYVTKAGYIDQTSGEIIVEAGKRTPRDVSLEKAPAALQILIEGKEGSELDFGAEIDVVERQFDIKNNGEEKLNWIISYSADWIKEVRPDEGELKAFVEQGVIVTIDRSLLESGPNTTKIHVTSNDGNKELTVKATNATSLPTLNTLEATNITSSTAVLNAEILTGGVPSYSERGFVYAFTSNPTLEDKLGQLTAKVTEENKYSALATGLELGKEYYVRGYAINEAGVAYSTNEVKFVPEMGLPNVTTESVSEKDLESRSATFNGTIVDEGDPAYIERGFVYGLAHNPSIDDMKKEVSGKTDTFSAKVSNLEVGKVYYVRAYAINDLGIAYGTDVELDFNGTVPQVKTKPATNLNIGAGTAVFHGEIYSLGNPVYSERGFVYNINHNPTLDDNNVKKVKVPGTSVGEYSSDVEELVVGNIYYARAYATNAQGTEYGSEVEVNFGERKPQVTTGEATNINLAAGTATLNGTIVDVGDPAYTERGFVYATVHNPTVEENADTKKVVSGTDSGAFSINISGLVLNTLYYVRAYATNSQGTVYGLEEELNMAGTLPAVTTSAVTGIIIESGTATFKGNVENLGNPVYTERGFVYSFTHNPTIDDTKKIVSGTGTGAFSANVTDLEMNKIYYIRAYATNAVGTSYGAEVLLDFSAVMPVVSTSAVTAKSIGAGTATFNGTITNIGDPAYTERGFVYGLTHNPTLDDTKKVVSGTGTGAFSANVTELEMNKIYYIRAYATNVEGTVYGSEVSADFSAVMPVLTTSAVTAKNIGAGTATFNGSIDQVGDPAYTERGFVYGLAHNPTLDDTKKVVSGSGTGVFSANITNLEMNKIYYIRAYATNVAGTVYGSEVSADFSAVMPVVTTSAVTAKYIGGGTATFNGKIESVGDPAYTERGFVYGLTHGPTIDDSKKVVSGSGTGAFSANVTELEMNKIYYIRAYATNVAGTVYGSEVSADFSAVMPVVTTSAATSIDIAGGTATLNGKIDSIGDPEYTERGFVYGIVHNPTVEDNTKKTAEGSGTGDFSVNVSNLVLNTIYYIRAYAKNIQGTSYGNEITLNFKGTVPTVKTNAPINLSIASGLATLNGSIENVGNPAYTERGFVYALTHNPNIVDGTKKIVSGSGSGAFFASLTNLVMNNVYYVRAYATNLQGTAYGNEVTLDFHAVPAAVTTNSAFNIDATKATLSATITKIGDPAYTEKGFVYGKNPNPTTLDNKVAVSGNGGGIFTWNLVDLEAQVTYYVRSYVIGNNNLMYGNEVNFYTESPYYYTLKAYGLVVAKEDAGGKMSWDTAVDACNNSALAGFTDWRLPTLDELAIVYQNKGLIGDFNRWYWSSNTYATNIDYARTMSFDDGHTDSCVQNCTNCPYARCVRSLNAAVETNDVSNIDATTATLNATVTSVGDPAYTERGFVYSKHQHPTTLDNKVIVAGSGAGSYSWNLTDLETLVTYYVRSYVISNDNVIYGNEVSFYTGYYYVLDNGLIVAREDAGSTTWSSAVDMCKNSRLAGFSDWHLPTIDELAILYNDKDLIGNFENTNYWSFTTYPDNSNFAYEIIFSNGSVNAYPKSNSMNVRCVRSLNAVVETNEVSNVDLTMATLSATIISIGDPAYTERGFVYGTAPNPTTFDNKVPVSGSGAGSFSLTLTNLETRVTYYVRSYVISNNDVIYGNEVSFYTESPYYYVLSDDLIVAREDVGESNWYSAFDLCSNSRLGGFNDWRLPTIDELVTIYNNLESIGNFTYDVVPGPYGSVEYVALYLSSSEYEYDEVEDAVWALDLIDGAMGYVYKTDVLHVRCVR